MGGPAWGSLNGSPRLDSLTTNVTSLLACGDHAALAAHAPLWPPLAVPPALTWPGSSASSLEASPSTVSRCTGWSGRQRQGSQHRQPKEVGRHQAPPLHGATNQSARSRPFPRHTSCGRSSQNCTTSRAACWPLGARSRFLSESSAWVHREQVNCQVLASLSVDPAAKTLGSPRHAARSQLQARAHLHSSKVLVAHPHNEQREGQVGGGHNGLQRIGHVHDAAASGRGAGRQELRPRGDPRFKQHGTGLPYWSAACRRTAKHSLITPALPTQPHPSVRMSSTQYLGADAGCEAICSRGGKGPGWSGRVLGTSTCGSAVHHCGCKRYNSHTPHLRSLVDDGRKQGWAGQPHSRQSVPALVGTEALHLRHVRALLKHANCL